MKAFGFLSFGHYGHGRGPGDPDAGQALKEAVEMWTSWQEELADGSLAAQGCIDVDGMTLIGKDPFLRQKYAPDVKKTVETERWVTSWLSAGGSLTE